MSNVVQLKPYAPAKRLKAMARARSEEAFRSLFEDRDVRGFVRRVREAGDLLAEARASEDYDRRIGELSPPTDEAGREEAWKGASKILDLAQRQRAKEARRA